MKKILNMKLWQKIVIVFLLVIVFNTIIVKPVQAVSADILLKPITGLFVGLADALEGVMQKIALGVDESLIHVEDKGATFLANVLVIGAFVLGTAIAIIAAIPTGGASLGFWVVTQVVVASVAKVAIALGTYIIFGSTITNIVKEAIALDFDLPQFALSPYEIFDNKITILDINFFHPKEEEFQTSTQYEYIPKNIPPDIIQATMSMDGEDVYVVKLQDFIDEYGTLFAGELTNLEKSDEVIGQPVGTFDSFRLNTGGLFKTWKWYIGDGEYYYAYVSDSEGLLEGFEDSIAVSCLTKYAKITRTNGDWIKNQVDIDSNIIITESFPHIWVDKEKFKDLYGLPSESEPIIAEFADSDLGTTWKYKDHYYTCVQIRDFDADRLEIIGGLFELKFSPESIGKSPANELRQYVAGWYVTLRNLALVALLSILVYIGIRIVLSSVASDKAKYKQMLIDWVVAICLLFIMHYIMSFSVFIVEKITEMVDSIQVSSSEKEQIKQKFDELNNNIDKEKIGQAVNIFVFDGTNDEEVRKRVKNAFLSVKDSQLQDFFYQDSNFQTRASNEDEAKVLVWPASNFMEEARMEYQIRRDNASVNVAQYGYGLIYVILVIYTIIFLFMYMKRVVYMAFLTVIAPLVAVTYPIDKLNDGKAQAFDMWFKEYLFNLLLQPLHLLLYSVLIGAAMNFATENLIYVIMALGFFMPAEKILRRFFGFEKAQTPGMFGGPAGSALMFSGLQRLMHPKPPHGGLGPGNGKDDKDGGEQDKAPRTQKIDESEGFLGEGNNNENNSDGFAFSDDTYTPGSGNFHLLDNNNQPDDNSEESTFRLDGFGANPNEIKANEYKDGEWSEANNDDTYTFAMNPSSDNTETTNPIQRNNQRTNETTGRGNLTRGQRIRNGLSRGIRGYRRGLHNRYVARKAQKGGMLRRGVRLAGGVAAATAFTTAAGLAAIVSGEPSKQIGNIVTAGVGGYKVGSNLGEKASGTVKNQKEMVQDALKEGKKGYKGNDYSKKQQEKYIKQFKKNEEYLNALQDKLNLNRKQAQEIMETHAEDYVNNGITDMDEFAAVYKLEQDFGNRDKAIATRHYAMERLDGKKVKNIDPEKKAKYDNMFMQEFMKRGKSQQEAANTVNELYDAVNRFHSYKK